MPRLWPRRLLTQLAVLIAIALFTAQAINFGLFLRERRAGRVDQVTAPAVSRLVDGEDIQPPRHSRLHELSANPIPADAPGVPAVADAMARQLREAGYPFVAVATGTRAFSSGDIAARHLTGHRAERMAQVGGEIAIAVEARDGRWIVQRAPWPHDDWFLVWRLIGQTLILYIIVLGPVLWIARRIVRPLHDLTRAAERFVPGDLGRALPERGPVDVSALIAAFNALRLRVAAMLDEKDRMLGAIGHDLRTPLAALRVRIESVDDDTDRLRMAETVDEMNRTLDDILSLARLGRPSEPPVEVDLPALVDAVVEDFRDLGRDVTYIEAPRLTMRLRPSLVRRAVRNLIENAVKYGGSAEVRIEPGAGRVAIVVADHGPGIPEALLADVFDAFTRLETSRNRDTGGIGLGLALARAIVRDAGGEITLANRAGGGLDATITLPR